MKSEYPLRQSLIDCWSFGLDSGQTQSFNRPATGWKSWHLESQSPLLILTPTPICRSVMCSLCD